MDTGVGMEKRRTTFDIRVAVGSDGDDEQVAEADAAVAPRALSLTSRGRRFPCGGAFVGI